jgi:hypothetical protein
MMLKKYVAKLGQYKFLFYLIFLLDAGCLNSAKGQALTPFFTENFDRGSVVQPITNGGTPTMTWTTATTSTGSASTTGATSRTNQTSGTDYALQILPANSAASQTQGATYVYGSLSTVSTPFSTTLNANSQSIIWTFNIRTNRATALSGFASGNYGGAVILASTNSNLTVGGNGYAITFIKGTSKNTIKLIKFSNGLLGTQTDLITSPSDTLSNNTNWASVKVVYSPINNNWQLFLREDVGTSPNSDFSSLTTQIGSTITDNTYTSSVFSNLGFLFNHSTTSSSTANTILIDNFSISKYTPIISPSVSNVVSANLNYTEGNGPSTPYNFTVSGSYLTANEIVSVPSNSNFELSTTSGGSYTNSISLSPMSGSVTNLTVYVRLKSGLAAGNYSENITIASTGATSQTVALSGDVNNPNSPAILSSLSTATFANTAIGSSSASQSATISGSNLQSAISISAPSGFQISTDGTTWSSSASFSPTNNSVSSLLYIRYTPTVNGSNYSGNITLTATGASAVNISVSGYLDKFYYKGTGDLSQVTSWSSTSDGTGTSTPLDFTHNNVYYYILTNATTVSLWTVAGTGSKIILGDPTIPGVSLTTTNGAGISTTSPAVLDITASSNATPNSLILNDPTNKPTAGSIHSTSELHYRNTISHGTTGTWAKVFIENNATVTFSSTPTIQTSLTIDNGATLYTNSGSNFCKMNINTNASITINGTVEVLNSAGLSCGNCTSSTTGSVFNFIGTPNITFGSNALVKYTKTNAQTIQPFAYPNLEISGTATKTISNSGGNNSIASVLNSLTVGTGATLATGGLLTLKSNASGTARIAQSAGSISGDVNVERYIPQNSNRAWRTLSVPTYGSQSIASSWKLGTLITGPATCTGMDATTNGYSMYTYSASGDSLLGVSSTASAINSSSTSPASYFLYVRGDRNTGLLNANTNPSATTLSTTGSVYQGQVSIDISANNASSATTYHLIGNPYVSPININSFLTNANNTNNIENTIYVWDPKMTNTASGVGGIVTLTLNGSAYDPNTSGLSYANGTTELPSGMAFFVQKKSSNCTTCSLVFTESMKSSGAITPNGFKTTSGLDGRMQINLEVKINDSTQGVADGLLALYDAQADMQVSTSEDALKMSNFGENMSIRNGTNLLAIEKRPLRTIDTLAIQTDGLLNRAYTLVFNPSQFDAGVKAQLIDHYLNLTYPIATLNKTTYAFIVDANTASKASNRFELLYNNQNALSISNTLQAANIQVYPNPTDGKVNIDMHKASTGNYRAQVLNAFGASVVEQDFVNEMGNSISIDLSAQAKGVYYLKISNAQHEQVVVKIIHL